MHLYSRARIGNTYNTLRSKAGRVEDLAKKVEASRRQNSNKLHQNWPVSAVYTMLFLSDDLYGVAVDQETRWTSIFRSRHDCRVALINKARIFHTSRRSIPRRADLPYSFRFRFVGTANLGLLFGRFAQQFASSPRFHSALRCTSHGYSGTSVHNDTWHERHPCAIACDSALDRPAMRGRPYYSEVPMRQVYAQKEMRFESLQPKR